tara:strand:- start:954 stop:1391 length:438 start_codon:yes stop_codon:yes gene_type:complete
MTAKETAQAVVDHILGISYGSFTGDVRVKKAYFPDKESFTIDEMDIFVAPSSPSLVQATRSSVDTSRTISIHIMSGAKIDATNETYDELTMDAFVDFVELIGVSCLDVESLSSSDFEASDYFDADYLQELNILATTINITYQEYL